MEDGRCCNLSPPAGIDWCGVIETRSEWSLLFAGDGGNDLGERGQWGGFQREKEMRYVL